MRWMTRRLRRARADTTRRRRTLAELLRSIGDARRPRPKIGGRFRAELTELRGGHCARYGHVPIGWLGPVYCEICLRQIGHDRALPSGDSLRDRQDDAGDGLPANDDDLYPF